MCMGFYYVARYNTEAARVCYTYSNIYYKTDNADEETLVGRYKAQLDYYASTLERLTGKKVKEKIIYSFKHNKEILL